MGLTWRSLRIWAWPVPAASPSLILAFSDTTRHSIRIDQLTSYIEELSVLDRYLQLGIERLHNALNGTEDCRKMTPHHVLAGELPQVLRY